MKEWTTEQKDDIKENFNQNSENVEDVDVEDIDESSSITRPFDPSVIKIDINYLTIQHLIERLEFDEINLYTVFQRRPGLWDKKTQSRLIESILLRMPIPAFYMDGKDENKWQVVDGLQRVSTIKNFILEKDLNKKLILQNLEYLKEFDGYSYDDFPRPLQRRIKSFSITIHVIQKGTPDEVKFNLFKRINTSGLVLTPQEIRHALNQGIPAEFVEELAEMDSFKLATDNSIKPDRMLDRDFVNRFLAFYLYDFKSYEPDLDTFLNKGMAALKTSSPQKREKIKDDFNQAMITAFEVFGDDAFRKRFHLQDHRKPINKALFDSISVNFSQISEEDRRSLVQKKNLFKEKLMSALNNNDTFFKSITSSTGDKKSVQTRFQTISSLIQETIES